MPLSKAECVKEAIQLREKLNAWKPGVFSLTDLEIKKIVDHKYANYVECYNIMHDLADRGKIAREIVAENNWVGDTTREASTILVDPKKSKEENKAILSQLLSTDEKKTKQQCTFFAANMLKTINLTELSEAGLNMENCIQYMKKNPLVGGYSYAYKTIAGNSMNSNSDSIANLDVFGKAIKDFGNNIEVAGRCREMMIFQSTPMSFLFKEEIPSISIEDTLVLKQKADEEYNLTHPRNNIKEEFSLASVMGYFTAEFSDIRKEDFQKNYEYIHENNITYLDQVTKDKNGKIVARSDKEKELLNNIVFYSDMEPGKAAESQGNLFSLDQKEFKPLKNKRINKDELKSVASKLRGISETHFSRKKPSRLARIFRTKYARGYAQERKVMDNYSKMLKKAGVSQETIDLITNRKGPKLPDDKIILNEVESINSLVDKRTGKKNQKKAKDPAKKVEDKAKNKTVQQEKKKEEVKTNENSGTKKEATITKLNITELKETVQSRELYQTQMQQSDMTLNNNNMVNESGNQKQ